MHVRILKITRRFPPAIGGVEHQVKEIAVRLAQRGHEVQICTSDLYSDPPALKRLPQDWRDRNMPFEINRYKTIQIPWRNAAEPLSPSMLCSLLHRNLPPIIHCHGPTMFALSTWPFIKTRSRCSKTICTTHVDPSIISGPFIPTMLRRFDGLVASTEVELRRLQDLGIDGSKTRVIPVGVDIDSFRILPGRESFRTKFRIANHLILYAGRIDIPTKGCDVLVKAVSRVQHLVGPCTLVFAGPDCGAAEYISQLSQHEKVRVIFTGPLNLTDLKSALVACDVFVLPSRKEASGIASLEAMLCGAPVVATRVGGIPTIVHQAETGLLVPAGDHHAMADAIRRILEDKKFSSLLATNGKAFALGFSIDRTVERLEAFYEDILRE